MTWKIANFTDNELNHIHAFSQEIPLETTKNKIGIPGKVAIKINSKMKISGLERINCVSRTRIANANKYAIPNAKTPKIPISNIK